MSFSTDVKEELSKLNNYTQKDCLRMELIGFCMSTNTTVVGKDIRFSTESQYTINRFAKLLSNLRDSGIYYRFTRKNVFHFLFQNRVVRRIRNPKRENWITRS